LADADGNDAIYVRRDRFGEWVLPVPPTVSEKDSFMAQVNGFIACLEENKPSMLNAEIGETVTAVLTAAYYSLAQGRRTVTLDEMRTLFESYGSGEDEIQRAIRFSLGK